MEGWSPKSTRVILQDENHTVWCTSRGKLIRSTPENTRRSLPEEGSPEGPELPPDITPMTQQINRMNHRSNQDDLLQKMPLEIFPENNPNNPPEDNPNEPDPNNPDATSQESQNESLSQPDQEPENLTPEDSQNDPMNSPEGEPTDTLASEDQELLYITSHEPSNAFTCEESGNLSWSCEFDIHLEEPLGTRVPTTEETWLLLATAFKKQQSSPNFNRPNRLRWTIGSGQELSVPSLGIKSPKNRY